MLKLIFVILTAMAVATNVVCCCLLKPNRKLLSRKLNLLNRTAMLTSVLYVLTLVNFGHVVSLALVGLYNASILWLLLAFFDYTLLFTDTVIDSRTIIDFRRLYKYFAAFAFINFASNIFMRHAMEISENLVNGNFFSWRAEFRFGFFVHLVVCYFLVAIIISEYVHKILRANKFYRKKYYIILFEYCAAVVFQCIFLFTKVKLDFSIFFFEGFVISATYFSFYTFPREIESNLLALVAENMTTLIFCFDAKKNCIYENKIAKKTFRDRKIVLKELEKYLAENLPSGLENISIKLNGNDCVFEEEFHAITDQNKKVLGYFIIFKDITNDINRIKLEKFKATHDLLTGAYNRKAFFEKAEQIIKSDSGIQYFMVSTNIKDFKLINDLFGSVVGDRILIKQAKFIENNEYISILGRISDDKFAFLIKKDDFRLEEILQISKVLQKEVQKVNYKIHLDIGIYDIPDKNESVYSMYDKSMMAAKSIRDNYSQEVAYYVSEMLTANIEEKRIISEFKRALEEKQFQMYLQPQILSEDNSVVGAEALVRWHHPFKGVVSPADFIETLEKWGYLYLLDYYIWECAAKKLSQWQESGKEMYIAVNISAKDFYQFDLYEVLTSLIKKYGINPSKLRLEVTETIFMRDFNFYAEVIEKLKDFGFLIETDDFGSAYSSFALLQNIKTDILKIDMAFLCQDRIPERSRKILTAIIEMGKKLGMSIVAEGVENSETAEFLKNAGCDIFQGYLYSEPILPQEFEERYFKDDFLLDGGQK